LSKKLILKKMKGQDQIAFQNRALDSFRDHEKSALHKASLLAWAIFRNSKVLVDVEQQLNVVHGNEIRDRREYLRRIIGVTTFLGKQGLPFRGHDETESQNQGNFVKCFSLLTEFDPFLQSYKAPSKTSYLSPASQNEVIRCCSEQVTFRIVSEMKRSGMYAIMADEARDKYKEQLAVCVRYVVPVTGLVTEHFLGFSELKCFDEESITESLQSCLRVHGLDDLLCVSQTYAGASVMSRSSRGVQAKFQKYHPEAIYIHCYAHELNMVLYYSCKAIKEASDFFSTLESVYAVFSASLINHKRFNDVQAQLGLKQRELVQLSDTHWSCQVNSVNALISNFPAVIHCLADIESSAASGLLGRLCKLPTVYCLFMFQSLLSTTEAFHKLLQKENLDLAKAIDVKKAVCSTLQDMRTNEKAKELYEKARVLFVNNGIDIKETALQRKKQKRVDDFIVAAAGGASEDISTPDYLKTKLFYPCLDRMLSELDQRFSSIKAELDLNTLANHYKIELNPDEIPIAKNYVTLKHENDKKLNMTDVYQLLDPFCFPTLKKVVQVALTLPANSCSCERSFGVLRRLHTWLRSTMGQDRLQHLAVLSIEKTALKSVPVDAIIDRFANMRKRRYELTLPGKI
uniref:Zinc finger MYM-type protein 1 n=1 Tax=Pelusios castaneus TaxID=367368 RepID=A0A8C8RK62_9SAUR